MRDLNSLSITSNFKPKPSEKFARCSFCWESVVVYHPGWWDRASLSFIFTKFVVAGLMEQVAIIVPLALYMLGFHTLVLNGTISEGGRIGLGLTLCIIGLFIFLEGLHHGLMELSRQVGTYLRSGSSWAFNLLVAFVIGTGVTMAEPAIIALQAIGTILNKHETPYLYYILNDIPIVLSLVIGLGVGIAVMAGFCKMRYGWQLRTLILATLIPTSVLAAAMSFHPELEYMVGLAWDCGAITTGEVTVPVVVALGSGIAATECVDNPFAGLGIVTIGSLIPIFTVQVLALIIWLLVPKETIIGHIPDLNITVPEFVMPEAVGEAIAEVERKRSSEAGTSDWTHAPGVHELKETLQITIPLILFLFWILRYKLREKIPHVPLEHVFEHDKDYEHRMKRYNHEPSKLGRINFLWMGLLWTVIGLFVFNVGLTQGLSIMGNMVGGAVPKLFVEKPSDWGPALYEFGIGVQVMLFFVFLLAYGATVAEPALEILGAEVEVLSKKKFTKRLLIHSISLGVAIGCILGLVRIVFQISLVFLALPLYLLSVILTFFSTEAILHVAWDAAAVTTGPVTVPLILGIGIATAIEVKAKEGFGILALASLCPVLVTLIVGLIIQIPFFEKWVAPPEEEVLVVLEDSLLLDNSTEKVPLPDYGTLKKEKEDDVPQGPYKGIGEVFVL